MTDTSQSGFVNKIFVELSKVHLQKKFEVLSFIYARDMQNKNVAKLMVHLVYAIKELDD